MFSDQAMRHADACRFCWMCRHLCPVGLMTGKEANTPRAKGLLVAMAKRGFPVDADTAQTMYECLLCGACTNDCVTGFEPPLYIREARTEAAVEGLTPAPAQRVTDRVLESGNPFGDTAPQFSTEGLPDKADVLLYLGHTARHRTPEIARALMSLLKKAGVSFTVLADEPGSGIELADLMGYVEDARQMAMACACAVNETGAKTLVVLDTYDAAAFRHEYADWGIALAPEVVTATAFVDGLVKGGKLAVKKESKAVTYHDGSRLARDLDEHQPARDLLAAMGMTVHEMFLNRRLAKCCGTALFSEYAPALARQVARGRWEDAQRTEAETLVTACPQSFLALSLAIPEGHSLEDVFVLLDRNA